MKKIWKDLNTEYFEKLIYFYPAPAIFSANETWGAKPSQNHPPLPEQEETRILVLRTTSKNVGAMGTHGDH